VREWFLRESVKEKMKMSEHTPENEITPKPKAELTEVKTEEVGDVAEVTEEDTTEPETAEETEKTEKPVRKTWIQNFSVKEVEDIETVDRLTIKAGINEYKGSMLVFLAKVTDKEFSRQFFSMPAYVWEKALPILQKYIPRIAEAEKNMMAVNVTKELERLKELGIDISTILKKVQ
jgi:hypothetical protein